MHRRWCISRRLRASHDPVDRVPVEAEDPGGLALVSADPLEDPEDDLALEFLRRVLQGEVIRRPAFSRCFGRRTSSGRSLSWITGPSARTTARSMTFWSSRTLPGHPYSRRAVRISGESSSTGLLHSRL